MTVMRVPSEAVVQTKRMMMTQQPSIRLAWVQLMLDWRVMNATVVPLPRLVSGAAVEVVRSRRFRLVIVPADEEFAVVVDTSTSHELAADHSTSLWWIFCPLVRVPNILI